MYDPNFVTIDTYQTLSRAQADKKYPLIRARAKVASAMDKISKAPVQDGKERARKEYQAEKDAKQKEYDNKYGKQIAAIYKKAEKAKTSKDISAVKKEAERYMKNLDWKSANGADADRAADNIQSILDFLEEKRK